MSMSVGQLLNQLIFISMKKKSTHTHHIIPKHAGGTDEPSNLTELSIEEHALAHKKLYDEYGSQQDLVAWKGLEAEIGKEEFNQLIGSVFGKLGNEGVPKSEEHKKKISQKRKTQKWDEQTKKKISESMKGNNNFKKGWSEERRKAFSERMKQSHKDNPRGFTGLRPDQIKK